MADNAQKTAIARTLNAIAQQKAADAIRLQGKALPATVVEASGSIVTVEFQVQSKFTLPRVTVPLFGPEWIRYPMPAGTKGVVFPADASLGGMTGLGTGIAGLSLPANLSALVFFPVGNADWDDPDAADKVIIYGPNGVIIRTADKAVKLELSPTGVAINSDFSATGNVALGGGAKKVVLDGDPVSGGVVHSTATKTTAS